MRDRGGDAVPKLQAELSRLGPGNPFQVLGITPFAPADAVRSAFLTAAKRFHPTLFALQSGEARELANEVFLLIRRAYAELIDDERRRVWRERLGATGPTPKVDPPAVRPPTPVQAKAEPQRPEPPKPAAAKPEPPKPAAPKPAAAKPTAPPPAAAKPDGAASDPSRRPPLRSPRVPLGPSQPKRDVADLLEQVRTRPQRIEDALHRLRKGQYAQAREALHQIAAEDPQNKRVRTYFHFAWGMEHREAGNVEDSARELERALKLDPTFAEAEKALRELGKGKRGLFSKIFGRE